MFGFIKKSSYSSKCIIFGSKIFNPPSPNHAIHGVRKYENFSYSGLAKNGTNFKYLSTPVSWYGEQEFNFDFSSNSIYLAKFKVVPFLEADTFKLHSFLSL